ncbi:unnamed protein product [Zymoseptoria tritici ST99CH_3D1]|nr:unnamed protein product [Zymoseptoria tritici ST99CH_3D1]
MDSNTRRGSRSEASDMESSRTNPSHRRRRDSSRSPRRTEDRKQRTRSREDSLERRKEPRSGRDRSHERRSHRHSRDDDSDRYRESHHRRERRERDEDDSGSEARSSRRERKHKDRSRSRDDKDRSYRRHRSGSPPAKKRRARSRSASKSPRKSEVKRSRAPLPSQNDSFRGEVAPGEAPPPEKQKPNFKPTGLLAKEANTVAGTTTVLKYNEPPEARKPSSKEQWRMYIFKGKDLIDTVYLYQRSVWLMGRDQRVTDLPIEHPSVSKQHAVIQFRYVTSTNEYGDRTSKVKPYLIDLESTKGTKLNGEKVEASRYVELRDQDVIGFGDSEREYVMMLPEK